MLQNTIKIRVVNLSHGDFKTTVESLFKGQRESVNSWHSILHKSIHSLSKMHCKRKKNTNKI